jgi:hypothetical protein
MSDYKDPRPASTASSADPCVIYDNAVSFNNVVNGGSTVTTYTGKSIVSLSQAINKFGFGVADFTFTDGGTLDSLNLLISNSPDDGYLYKYVGAGSAPIVVAAETDPTVGSDWQAFSATSHNLLSDRDAVGSHDSIYRRATTVAEIATGVFKVGDRLEVTDRDNQLFQIVSSDPSPAYYLSAGTGKYAKLIVSDEMNIKSAGASGADNESVSLYISRLILSGCKNIYIPNASIQVGSLTATGVKFRGNNCVITSGQINDAELDGITHIYTGVTDEVSACPQFSGSVSQKLIARSSDVGSTRALLVCTPSSSGKGYVLHTYKDNDGDSSSTSYGVNWGLMRSVFVEPVFSCVALKYTPSADSGNTSLLSTSLEFIMSQNTNNPLNSDGTTTANTLKARQLDSAEWVEYTLAQSRMDSSQVDGNVAFYSSNVVSNSFTVTCNGVTVYTGSASKLGTENNIWTIPIRLTSSQSAGSHVIRVTNNDANPLYVLGVNFYQLRDLPANADVDTWKMWRDNPNPFININGASDYAIYDDDEQVFVGSYHGGETSTDLKLSFDGVQYDLTTFAAGSFKIAKSISIKQKTSILGKLSTYVNTTHYVDGVQSLKVSMTGSMNVGTFYTMLTPTYREFDYITHPYRIANGAATTLQNIGQQTDIVQTRESTGQYVRTAFSRFDLSKNSRGCCYLDNKEGSVGVIQTRKIYYGPVYSNLATINNISFEVQREFGSGKY